MNALKFPAFFRPTQPYTASGFARLVMWCVILLATPLFSKAEVTLEWDATQEPSVKGYMVHYGTVSGHYSRTVDAGNATHTGVPDLVTGFTYYLTVTAYNEAGLESEFSNEIVLTVPQPTAINVTYQPRLPVPLPPGTPAECKPAVSAHGRFSFMITAPEQTAFTIYASSDLNTWKPLGSVMNPTGRLLVVDVEDNLHPTRFYRAKQVALDPPADD